MHSFRSLLSHYHYSSGTITDVVSPQDKLPYRYPFNISDCVSSFSFVAIKIFVDPRLLQDEVLNLLSEVILDVGDNIQDKVIFSKDKFGLIIANKNLKVLNS